MITFIVLTLFMISLTQGYNVFCPCESTQYFDHIAKECIEKTGNCDIYDINLSYSPDSTNTTDISSKTYICDSCEEGYIIQASTYTCQPITVPNCLLAQIQYNLETCRKCEPNYYQSLDRFSCLENPTNESNPAYHPNCTRYQLYGTTLQCQECSGNFYAYGGDCVAYPTSGQEGYIEGCLQYGKIGSYTICTQCNEDYSFGQRVRSSVCQAMDNVVGNCTTAKPDDSSKCKECKEGFIYSSIYNTCNEIPKVSGDTGYLENCMTYKYEGTLLKCDKCKVGYVHKDSQCEEVPSGSLVPDCVEYEYDSDDTSYSCTNCKDKYWSGGNDLPFSACEQCPALTIDPNNPDAPVPNPDADPSGSSIIGFSGLILILAYIII